MQNALPWVLAIAGLGVTAYLVLSEPEAQQVAPDRSPTSGATTSAADGYDSVITGIVNLISGGIQIAQSTQKTTV